jgi:hypothetical protein
MRSWGWDDVEIEGKRQLQFRANISGPGSVAYCCFVAAVLDGEGRPVLVLRVNSTAPPVDSPLTVRYICLDGAMVGWANAS